MTVAIILGQKGRNVITASPEATLNDIIQILSEKKIGAIVLVEGGDTVCGIISERDIVRRIANDGTAVLDQAASTCMTHNVVSCQESDTISQVMEKMTAGRFRHVPVMQGQKLIGMISIGDIVKARIEEAEREAEEMKRYIAG